MEIKLLEQICWGGSKLAPVVDRALSELGIDDEFEMIGDMAEILTLGVMSTPALMINGKVVVSGRIPSVAEAKELIEKYR